MTNGWRLNGRTLGRDDDDVEVEVQDADATPLIKRNTKQDETEGRQVTGNEGQDLGERTLTFVIINNAPDTGRPHHYDEMERVLSTLEDNDTVLLQSPDVTRQQLARAFRAFPIIWFEPERAQVPQETRTRLQVPVEGTVVGVPHGVGGDDELCITGTFEFDGTDYTRDDGTNTGSNPLVQLPEQRNGYPLARKRSDFSRSQPPLDSTVIVESDDGTSREEEKYDMSDFIIPNATSAGEAANYEICSSPTNGALKYVRGSGQGGSFSAHSIGAMRIGGGP